jgi:hypothetical protein
VIGRSDHSAFTFLVAHGRRREARGRLHRHQAEQLQQVALHHVAQRARGVVEVPAAADPDGLGHGDLHLLDGRGAPQRLEDRVGEAQREQVLDRLLAEIVVDAEDVPFVDGLGDGFVGAIGRRGVGADRLFDDDAVLLSVSPAWASAWQIGPKRCGAVDR